MPRSDQQNWEHRVLAEGEQMRLVDYCGDAFSMLGSKSATKKAIDAGRITINGVEADGSEYLVEGDFLTLTGSGISEIKEYKVDVPVVYEDQYLMIVNKPGGIAVNGNRYKTLENALARANIGNPLEDALPRPIAVHRIDVPTKGLVMFAKTKSSLIALGKAFEEDRIKKQYLAVVHGKTKRLGKMDLRIEGKKALTQYKRQRVVQSRVFEHLSLVALQPHTGRTHQLRIHLKNEGHLIVGDKEYAGSQKTILGKGLFLCAQKLEFRHPVNNGLIQAEVEMPSRFKKLMDREEDRFF